MLPTAQPDDSRSCERPGSCLAGLPAYVGRMSHPAIRPFAAAAFLAVTPMSLAGAQETYRVGEIAIQAEIVADGLEHPWGLDFLPDGDAIVTERLGRLRLLSGGRLSDPIEGVPDVYASGQGGLLDVRAAPDFETSGLVFLSFSEPGSGGAGTAVARGKLVREGASARLDNAEVIFSMARKTGKGQHFGSRLVFAPTERSSSRPAIAAKATARRIWRTAPARC